MADCFRLAHTIPAKMNALFRYFITSVTARLLLCLGGIFVPGLDIEPFYILVGGLFGDFIFALILTASDSGKNGILKIKTFRYPAISNFMIPALTGLVSAASILLAYLADRDFLQSGATGLLLVFMAISSLFNGAMCLQRERVAVTPLGWIPIVIYALGLLAFLVILILVPPLAELFLLKGFSAYSLLIGVCGGFLQLFSQKIAFGKEILI